MEIFIFYLALSAIVGVMAVNIKNRNFFCWTFIAMVMSPILAGVAIFLVSEVKKVQCDGSIQTKKGTMKKCPKCAELVKNEATICRYCGNNLSD